MALYKVNRFLEETAPQQGNEILERLRLQASTRKALRDKRTTKAEVIAKERAIGFHSSISPAYCQKTVNFKKQTKNRKENCESVRQNSNQRHVVMGAAQGISVKQHKRKRDELSGVSADRKSGSKNKKVKQVDSNTSVVPGVDESWDKSIDNEDQKIATEGNFAIIGEEVHQKRERVSRVIPDWLAQPTVISADLKKNLTEISELNVLHPTLVSLLRSNGVEHFFPVQSVVIPHLLETFRKSAWLRPRDVCVSAPTGSGKTLAYALPIIQALSGRIVCSIKALVVLPVIDLAAQVYKVFKTYCKSSGLQVGLATGQSVLATEQASLVRKGCRKYLSLVDILICTPGRLVDHINFTPGFSLQDLRFLVIDEADRMMQHIKQGWLSQVERSYSEFNDKFSNLPLTVASMDTLKQLPQKLLFSATLSHNPEKLQEMKLFQPHLFTSVVDIDELQSFKVTPDNISDSFIGKYTFPKELTQCYVVCDVTVKPLVLLHFICNLKFCHILCFTNSVESSHRLSLLLSAYGDVSAKEFSSNLNIHQRNKILKQFSQGSIDVLVCSDAMARGMDVENVEYVISYDMPPYLKTYIHRVGRTARAGRPGTAISFLQYYEVEKLQSMISKSQETKMKRIKVSQSVLEPMEEKFRIALKQVADAVAEKPTKGTSVKRHH